VTHNGDLTIEATVELAQLALLGDDEGGELWISGRTRLDQHPITVTKCYFRHVFGV
jgi:hypothetical protein